MDKKQEKSGAEGGICLFYEDQKQNCFEKFYNIIKVFMILEKLAEEILPFNCDFLQF